MSFVQSICPSVRKGQIVSHQNDIHEIWCLNVFWKSVEKIQYSLKSYKNNGTLHEYICDHISLSSS
jgi:hypothetical protein